MKSHLTLVERIKAEQVNLKALPETDLDQKNAKLTAIAETGNHSQSNWRLQLQLAGS